MKLLIFGASGATGQHVCRLAKEAGWGVHAFVRSQAAASRLDPAYEYAIGDPMNPEDVAQAMVGSEAVAVCLGISRQTRSPFAAPVSPLDLTSRSVEAVLQAMHAQKTRRIVYVSAFGASESWSSIPWWGRAFLGLTQVRHSMVDHTRSEALLARSGLDWTTLRPMMLDDASSLDAALEMKPGDSLLKKVSREALARTVIQVLDDRSTIGRSIALVP
ncbi:MAG: NAD(P)-dependent oxidoreductase [Betaproteobacteria bacterium]|nr:NAD(P)-dependent oxidoreductase [Betaproteobacteria bacterium]